VKIGCVTGTLHKGVNEFLPLLSIFIGWRVWSSV